MNYLNSKYKLFEKEINNIVKKCEMYNIQKYAIDDNGLLNVNGDVDLSEKSLNLIPFKFKEVDGDFIISDNNITSLYGSPLIVTGGVFASNINIKNLKYAPVEIGMDFYCGYNYKLISLKHFPKHVGNDVVIWNCINLKSLYGCLRFLNGGIDIDGCCNLNTLKYGPNKVLGYYTCKYCKLKTLYGAPEYVGGVFDCSYNEITSLKYSPRHIGGDFNFKGNFISSFEYFPDYVGDNVNCVDNPVNEIWELFRDKDKVEYFNQLKIINCYDKKINIKKLNIFLNSII